MATHHTTSITGADLAWQAKCTCRWRSKVGPRSMADDAKDQHDQYVQRSIAALHHGKQMTYAGLRSEYQWYLQQAQDPSNSDDERALWQQLAEELARRLPRHTAEQSTLW